MTSPAFSRVEELFHAALERAPAEREGFLRDACGGAEELRREVESLLAQEPSAERMLERPAASVATRRLAVTRGTHLGPYEVLDLVGAGGMGEVYRARDTRLGRDVAVKVLPADFACDPERLRRFEREARAVAALSHPNIAALFDVGNAEGTHYLVMELLEGETLAGRLKRGPLPEREALRVGAEIGAALGAAHAHGVVHRDVKPANVVLMRTGSKLLDFGLARRQGCNPAAAAGTATTGLDAGVVAGTLPYMAPEQLEGRAADSRSDVWALGCVLFEMLTGARAFEADSPALLVAAIEKDDAPSVMARRPGTSPGLDRLVRQCLQKDPDERWSSAHDFALRLREIAETGDEETRPGRGPSRWRATVTAGVALAASLAGLVAGRLWLQPRERARPAEVVRSEVDLGGDSPLTSATGSRDHPSRTELALSPDGVRLAWSAALQALTPSSVLYQRRLDTGEVTRIPGTEGARQPFFSPDSRWIGFFAREGSRYVLRKIPADGGLRVDLAEFRQLPTGAFWAADGGIFVGAVIGYQDAVPGIQRVPAEGGPVRAVTTADPIHESGHRLPFLLPGGRALLFTSMATELGTQRARIEVARVPGGERKVLVEDGADGRYLASGHLVFARRGVLMAAPVDLDRLELTAAAVPVVPGVCQAVNMSASAANSAAAQFAVSERGLLVYAPGGIREDQPVELLLMDASGRVEPLPGFDKPLVSPQVDFSPDGRQMAFVEQDRSGLLWLFDPERRTYRALSDRGVASAPRWSPDGASLVVGWTEAGPFHLWRLPATGGKWEQLTDGPIGDWAPAWSPDGRLLAFVRGTGILLYRFEDRKLLPFLATKAGPGQPEFSPDGRWLAYVSAESGRLEVYLTSLPDGQRTITVSNEGGEGPKWSRDGRTLFYHSTPAADGTQSMMTVAVRGGSTPSLGRPNVLCRLPENFLRVGPMQGYALHPDGRRFVVGRLLKTARKPPITRLVLVHDWFAELNRLAPRVR